MYRGKVTEVDAKGVYVQTAEFGTLGPCQAVVANYTAGDMVLCVNVGDEASPELVVVGRLTTTTSSATVGDDGVVTVTGSLTPVMRFANASSIAAKTSSGTYEQFLWPRWSDNVMYMNYGSAGWNIRNSSSLMRIFVSDAGKVTIAVPGEGIEMGSSGPTITSGTGAPSHTPPNGSIYLRTDGTASTTLYVRADGSWTALT